jgi:hypothetical protein
MEVRTASQMRSADGSPAVGVTLLCPECRAKLTVPEKLGKRRFVCPLCATNLRLSTTSDEVYQLAVEDRNPAERGTPRTAAAPTPAPIIHVTVKNVHPRPREEERSWLARHLVEAVGGVVVAVVSTALLAVFGLGDRDKKPEKNVAADAAPATAKSEPQKPAEAAAATTKAEPTPPAPAKGNPRHAPAAGNAAPGQFVGRWKLVNDKGVVGSYLTVTSSFSARRDHVPDFPGRWEVVGKEARFTWDDGYRDIMRLEGGKMTFLGLGKESKSWDSSPIFRLQAVRIAR